jgi:hypothetical protein
MNYNIIKNNLYKYKILIKKFNFVKNKNNYFILDGIIKYKINTRELTCACSKYFCEHIIFFLVEVYKINIEFLLFYNKFKNNLLEMSKNKSDIQNINQKINEYITNNLECVICFCSLLDKKFNYDLVECSICSNYCHKYCFQLYKSKNCIINNTCIYCKCGVFL